MSVHNGVVEPEPLGLDLWQYVEIVLAFWKEYQVYGLIVIYLYWSLCIYKIARKADLDHAFLGFVPVLQGVVLAEAGTRSLWWGVWLHLPIAGLISRGYIGIGLAEQRDQSRFLGALCGLPGFGLIILGYFAFFDPPQERFDLPLWAAEPDRFSKSHRSELPENLPAGRAACRRCGLVYEVLPMEWCDGGFCSLACLRRAEQVGEATS